MKTCPDHRVAMTLMATRYGGRYQCPVEGCTMACWDGHTSTPADAETRNLRKQCHVAARG